MPSSAVEAGTATADGPGVVDFVLATAAARAKLTTCGKQALNGHQYGARRQGGTAERRSTGGEATMNTHETDALLIVGDDGSLYAIPCDVLAQCKVEGGEAPEVQGYLNPQPIPPGFTARYDVLGFSPVSITGALPSAQPFGIIFVGGRTR